MKKKSSAVNPYQSLIEGKDPMKILASTHSRVVRLAEGLTTRQLGKRVSEDKWSIYEIVGHLADVETVHSGRCRWILFEDNPPLPAFDEAAWTEGWLREKESFKEALERFRALRQSQMRLFRNLKPDDLHRAGTHSERGTEQLELYILKSAGHDLNHLRQIAERREMLLSEKRK